MLTALLLLATSASAVQTVFPWYPNTFPGAVYFDSTTYVPEIQWADGSTSTTAVQGGVQNIYISTIPGPTGATGPQGPQGATGGIQYVSASTSSVGWFVDSLACPHPPRDHSDPPCLVFRREVLLPFDQNPAS